MSAARDPIEEAAAGRLPPWAQVSEARLAHIGRVAALMDSWAAALALDEAERRRWRAAAWLHDALRDAPAKALRAELPPPQNAWPAALLHGPAVAARLRAEGMEDEGLLRAIAYHTLGHPELDLAGRALYLADFLEPGRGFTPASTAALRARMPEAMDAVLRNVVALRLRHLVESGHLLRPETVDFWNAIVEVR